MTVWLQGLHPTPASCTFLSHSPVLGGAAVPFRHPACGVVEALLLPGTLCVCVCVACRLEVLRASLCVGQVWLTWVTGVCPLFQQFYFSYVQICTIWIVFASCFGNEYCSQALHAPVQGRMKWGLSEAPAKGQSGKAGAGSRRTPGHECRAAAE